MTCTYLFVAYRKFLWVAALVWLLTDLHAQALRIAAPTIPPGHHAFGHAIAIGGDYLVIGDPSEEFGTGAVYVYYQHAPQDWKLQQRLLHPERTAGDAFGYSVALNDTYLVVGAPEQGAVGSAYVFFRDHTRGWQEIAKLEHPEPGLGDRFGHTVAINDFYAFVGSPFDDTPVIDAGSVHLFLVVDN